MSEGFDTPDDGSVTWVITHQVRPDRRDDFENWIAGIVLPYRRPFASLRS